MLAQTGPLVNWAAFTLAPQGIYFIPTPPAALRGGIHFSPMDQPSRTAAIYLQHWTTGKIERVLSIGRHVHFGLSNSPDGRSLVFTVYDEPAANVMLVEGFR